MSAYRIYVLNGEEHVAIETEAEFPDDIQALEHAEEVRADQYAAEVWDGDRLVGRLGAEFRIPETA